MTFTVPEDTGTGMETDEDLQAFVQSTVRGAVEAANITVGNDSFPISLPTQQQVPDKDFTASERPSTSKSTGSVHQGSTHGRPRSHRSVNAGKDSARQQPVDADFPIVPGASCADQLDVPGQPQATVRLHKAQIRALERDLEAAKAALEARSSEAHQAREELRTIKAEATGACKASRALEGTVARLQKQADELKGQLAARDAALRQVSDDAGHRDRDRRAAEGDLKARNARLNRALDEVQRYRKLLEEAKARESNQQSVVHSEYNRVVNDNRKLERQKAELLAAFKKQLKLIDVLKRQKVHVEAARMLQFAEDEFMRALEMPATTF